MSDIKNIKGKNPEQLSNTMMKFFFTNSMNFMFTTNSIKNLYNVFRNSYKGSSFVALKQVVLPLIIFLSFGQLYGQNELEIAVGSYSGAVPSGPVYTTQTATVMENTAGTSFVSYSPIIKVTANLTNQQYFTASMPNGAMAFGATTSAIVAPATAAVFNKMITIGAGVNSTFTSSATGAAGTGIDVNNNYAFYLFNSVQPLLGTSLTGRAYYADLTLTFNRPVTNPVIQIVGLGGTGATASPFHGHSAELELQTLGVTLSSLSGSAAINVTANKILNNATTIAAACGTGGACGSILATGTNITTLTFRVYVRGDANGSAWGATTTNSGDSWMIGVSLAKPATNYTNLVCSDLLNTSIAAPVSTGIGNTYQWLLPAGATRTNAIGSPDTLITLNLTTLPLGSIQVLRCIATNTNSCSDTSLINLVLPATNCPPIAINDAITTNVSTAVSNSVATNDYDATTPTSGLTFSSLTSVPASQGVLVFSSTGSYTFTPTATVAGPVVINYNVCDPQGLCTPGVLTITINHYPVALNDTTGTYKNTTLNSKVSFNDRDVDGNLNANSYIKLDNPINGGIVFNANGTYAYTPTTGFLGRDSIHYKVCDNGSPALCDTAVLVFTIVNPLCTGQLSSTPLVNITFGTGGRDNLPNVVPGAVTDQIYSPSGGVNDNYYTIANNGNIAGSWALSAPDHTDGSATGRLMVINAAHHDTIEFFRLPVTGLCTNTTYQFSAWIRSIYTGSDLVNVSFDIRNPTTDEIVYSVGSGSIIHGAWYQHGFTFNTGSSTNFVFVLRNNNPAGNAGNDLVLDDIQFTHCGPSLSAVASGSTTVCAGSSVTLNGNLSAGYVSPQYQWQVSTDGGTSWSNVASAISADYTFTPTISNNGYKYRVLSSETGSISFPTCRINSNAITLTVTSGSAGGTAAYSGSALCSTTNSGNIFLSGHTGSIVKWQTSTDAGTSWSDIVSTANPYPFSNAANDQQYRAVVNNGTSCVDANSVAVVISQQVAQPLIQAVLCVARQTVVISL
jgi:hypothetical protein